MIRKFTQKLPQTAMKTLPWSLLLGSLALLHGSLAVSIGEDALTPLGEALADVIEPIAEFQQQQLHPRGGGGSDEGTEERAVLEESMKLLGRALINVPPSALSFLNPKSGLSASCSNKLCTMFEWALSCKAIGINLKKICAQYLLGRILQCPIFPSPYDITNMPSVCTSELSSLATILQNGGGFSPTSGVIGGYLGGNMTDHCGRNCYQSYLNATIDFYGSCSVDLDYAPNNHTYPVTLQFQNFRQMKSQVCAHNTQGSNCFQTFYASQQTKSPINVFNQYCNYDGLPQDNAFYLFFMCVGQFTPYGCCFASGAAMLAQNQVNASNIKLFPPCLMNYMTRSCHSIDLTNYCTKGANSDTTLIRLSIKFPLNSTFPNMYDQANYLNFQGVVIGSLINTMTANDMISLGLNQYKPFPVMIYNYTYFKNGVALTNASGIPYSLDGGDYKKANSALIYVQFVMSGLNSSQADFLYNALSSSNYQLALRAHYKTLITVKMMTHGGPQIFVAEPYHTEKNAGAPSSLLLVNGMFAAIVSVVIAALLL